MQQFRQRPGLVSALNPFKHGGTGLMPDFYILLPCVFGNNIIQYLAPWLLPTVSILRPACLFILLSLTCAPGKLGIRNCLTGYRYLALTGLLNCRNASNT
jgi:hypothetical protein